MKRALVLGGSGAVGRRVVGRLVQAGVATDYTWFHTEVDVPGATGHRVDLREMETLADWLDAREPPDIVIHCAAMVGPTELVDVTPEAWLSIQAVNCQAAFVACQRLAPRMSGGDIVLVGALDRGQSLPLPVAFAASQGMVGAMTMALAKALGPRGFRVNLVCAGLLESGLSSGIGAGLREDFLAYSALRRIGTPDEVARAVVWLALHNRYMNGRALPVNGGI